MKDEIIASESYNDDRYVPCGNLKRLREIPLIDVLFYISLIASLLSIRYFTPEITVIIAVIHSRP